MARKVITFTLLLTLFSIAASPPLQGVRSQSAWMPLLAQADYSAVHISDHARSSEQVKPSRGVAAGFLGGSRSDAARAVAVDSRGDIYITGNTDSADFPVTPGAYDVQCGIDGDCDYGARGYGYNTDVFVAKIDTKTGQLVYATYIGGEGFDYGWDIAVDQKGAAYVTGDTYSDDFPTTEGAFNRAGGYGVSFIFKLSPDGSHLEYSTSLSSYSTQSRGIAVDQHGSAYVTGWTHDENFPTTPGAYNPSYMGGAAFVSRLDPQGSQLVYSTFLGLGSGQDIQVDSRGTAYITGSAYSADFPTTPGAFDTSFNDGFWDIFVSKLSPNGDALLYSTFLGGSGFDAAVGLAVDPKGAVAVVGNTTSLDIPVTAGAYREAPEEIFVARFKPDGSGLYYATYLGGSDYDAANNIATNTRGEVFVAGVTGSTDFPVTPDALDPTCGSDGLCSPDMYGSTSIDGFLTKLDAQGTRLGYSSYLGGRSVDNVWLALSNDGTLNFAGFTNSPDFPVAGNLLGQTMNGLGDAFVGWLRIK